MANTNSSKTGRPSEFSPEVARQICERLIGDPPESLRSICRDESMPSKTTVLRWLNENEEFRTQYAHAREVQADCYRDEGDEISRGISTSEDAQVARVQLDWIKWNAARMAPKKYGDKVDMNLGGQAGNPIQAAIAVTFVSTKTKES